MMPSSEFFQQFTSPRILKNMVLDVVRRCQLMKACCASKTVCVPSSICLQSHLPNRAYIVGHYETVMLDTCYASMFILARK
jgi:hypothetical protein